jgi:hypothetical protein
MKKSILILALGLMTSLVARAQEIPTEFDAVRISPVEATSDANLEEGLTVTYDPAELKDAPKVEMGMDALEALAAEMATDEYKKTLEEKIVIPVSTASKEDLAYAKRLSPDELTDFLSKKTKFLNGVVKTLSFIHLKAKSINKMVFMMNDRFFKKSGVIAHANSRVYTLQLAVGGGVGFSDWIMGQLKRSPYFKDLPERSGFYFMAGTGFSVGRTFKDGKSSFFIEPIVEFRRATKIFSPFVFGAAGLIGGATWEHRATNEAVQSADFYKVSSLTIIDGVDSFGFSGAAAFAFPPGGGAVAGMEGKVTRVRLTPALISSAWSRLMQFAQMRGSSKIRCSGIFE